ncbi:S8 family peptidase [Halobacillus litoralis]|uniref:S8 family serine peptidase n=1 Tax=Halobacillus litoralis TaxID=45668 RepID=UPI001CD3FB5A|nr:S8 family serine peptidase [Halobacillus litoralis]MCA0971498.1 S8 family peptidase [Halobacillus litoralis]
MKQTVKKTIVPLLWSTALLFGLTDVHTYAEDAGEQEVIAVYKNEAGKQAISEAGSTLDNLTELQALSVSISDQALERLENNPNVEYIEKESSTSLMGRAAQWNVEAVHAPEAWADGYTGAGVKVAVIDSGVNADHPDLDIEKSISFVSDNAETTTVDESSPMDQAGHGTHVAGVIAANFGGERVYDQDVAGVAPDVELYSLKAIAKEEGSTLDIIEAINWCIENDIDIINLSVGSGEDTPLFEEAVNKAYESGILIVGASGNDGQGTDVRYPARYDSVVAVSSVDKQNELSSFSSFGPEVEFTAPGEPIVSTYEDSYATMGGTSQAAPHITGFLALLKQKHPDMTVAQLRDELRKYTIDLGETGRDEKFGYGFVDYSNYDGVPPEDVQNIELTEQNDGVTLQWDNPADSDFHKVNVYVNGKLSGETELPEYHFDRLGASQSVTLKTVDLKGNESDGVVYRNETELAERAAAIQDKLSENPDAVELWEIEAAEYAAEKLNDPAMEQLTSDLEAYKKSIGLKEFKSVQANPTKDFTVEFNTEINADSIGDQDVFVRHNGQFVEGVKVTLSESGKVLTIHAPEAGYSAGDYSLYISADVSGQNGQGLSNPVVMDFSL